MTPVIGTTSLNNIVSASPFSSLSWEFSSEQTAFSICTEIQRHMNVYEHFVNHQNTLTWMLMAFRNLGNSIAPEFKNSCLFASICHIVTADVCRAAWPGSLLLLKGMYQAQVSRDYASQSGKANKLISMLITRKRQIFEELEHFFHPDGGGWTRNLYRDGFLDSC